MAGMAGIAGSLAGCLAMQKDKDAVQSIRTFAIGSGEGIDAFAQTAYPYLRQNCASCHGAGQSPTFAVDDVAQAYSLSKPLANFADTSASTFARKGSDSHCGSICSSNGALMAVIDQWKAAEVASGIGGDNPTVPTAVAGPNRTQPVGLPSPLASGTQYSIVRWDLSQVTPFNPDLAGVIMEAEVQRFTTGFGTTPGSIRIRKPKIATPTNNLYVQGIRILVNGKIDAQAVDFADTDVAILAQPIPAAPTPLPFPVLSAAEMILLQDKETDLYTIAFDNIRKTGAVACRALNTFLARARPVMAQRCFGCHAQANAQNPNAQRKFNQNAPTDAELCARAMQRITRDNPATSPIIVNPKNNANGHPNVQGLTTADMDNILAWVVSE